MTNPPVIDENSIAAILRHVDHAEENYIGIAKAILSLIRAPAGEQPEQAGDSAQELRGVEADNLNPGVAQRSSATKVMPSAGSNQTGVVRDAGSNPATPCPPTMPDAATRKGAEPQTGGVIPSGTPARDLEGLVRSVKSLNGAGKDRKLIRRDNVINLIRQHAVQARDGRKVDTELAYKINESRELADIIIRIANCDAMVDVVQIIEAEFGVKRLAPILATLPTAAGADKEDGWRSVDEKLPAHDQDVLMEWPNGVRLIGKYFDGASVLRGFATLDRKGTHYVGKIGVVRWKPTPPAKGE